MQGIDGNKVRSEVGVLLCEQRVTRGVLVHGVVVKDLADLRTPLFITISSREAWCDAYVACTGDILRKRYGQKI